MTNEDVHLELGQLISGLKALKNEVVGMRRELVEVKTEVKSLTEFKNNGKGIILGVALAASGVTAVFKLVWDYLRGHIV